jgi:hypothetical protein
VFWIQLTWNNVVFSRITLVSHFCAEIQLSGKILENIAKILFYQKYHGARRQKWRGATRGSQHLVVWVGQGHVRGWCGHPSHRLDPLLPPTYSLWPKNIRGSTVFPNRVPLRHHHQKPRFGTRNSVLAPCRDGDLEEIITIIITDVSPSTIHNFPIHVWVIPAIGRRGW